MSLPFSKYSLILLCCCIYLNGCGKEGPSISKQTENEICANHPSKTIRQAQFFYLKYFSGIHAIARKNYCVRPGQETDQDLLAEVLFLLQKDKAIQEPAIAELYKKNSISQHPTYPMPMTLESFASKINLAERPKSFVRHSRIPNLGAVSRNLTRIYKNNVRLSIAESIDQDKVIETEIIYHRSAEKRDVDFYVYDQSGNLSSRAAIAKGGQTPYLCYSCHINSNTGQTSRKGSIGVFLQPRPDRTFKEISRDCQSCHNPFNDLKPIPFDRLPELRAYLEKYLPHVRNRIKSLDSPMPPDWPLNSAEQKLFLDKLESLIN